MYALFKDGTRWSEAATYSDCVVQAFAWGMLGVKYEIKEIEEVKQQTQR